MIFDVMAAAFSIYLRCTMVIISHQERIISLADEILVIDKGEIARRGTRDEVFADIVHSTTGGCPVIYGEAKK